MVLYKDMESWYVENSEPVAIYLKPDEVAVYPYNVPKMCYADARHYCKQMDLENLYWEIPNTEQLQLLLNLREAFDRTAELIKAEKLLLSLYWGRMRINQDYRLGVNFAWEKEAALAPEQYAYTRPFLRL